MKTVLIVDADSGSTGLAETLQRRGYRGISALNAREALAIIQEGASVDLIVTEIQFPDMDGLHFLIALRAIAPGVPIIVVTSSGSIESYLHAVNLGVYEYFNKPVPPKELIRIATIALAGPWTVPPVREASCSAGHIIEPALLLRSGAAESLERQR